MFSLDDRSGNVLTTVALFVVAAAIVYVARGAFFISKQRRKIQGLVMWRILPAFEETV
jgi:hypothetical protein